MNRFPLDHLQLRCLWVPSVLTLYEVAFKTEPATLPSRYCYVVNGCGFSYWFSCFMTVCHCTMSPLHIINSGGFIQIRLNIHSGSLGLCLYFCSWEGPPWPRFWLIVFLFVCLICPHSAKSTSVMLSDTVGPYCQSLFTFTSSVWWKIHFFMDQLCAWGRCHVETGNCLFQTPAIRLEAC